MKSKIVRGIINGGVLAAVAALGITVYQLGTKPIAENPQEENSVQVEETDSHKPSFTDLDTRTNRKEIIHIPKIGQCFQFIQKASKRRVGQESKHPV